MKSLDHPAVRHAPARRDLVVVVAATLLAMILAASFELSEVFYEGTRRWEHLQLDELPIALFVLAVGLMWFAHRRQQQIQMELGARRAAEEQLARALAENRSLVQEHIRMQESERKHLARELHDELGQYLNAIKLDAVLIHEQTCDDADEDVSDAPGGAARKAALDIIESVDHVHGVVSGMIRRLRPVGLDELGLVAALENCVDHWRERLPDTRFSFDTAGRFDDLGESLKLTLYRLVQEALTNCYKHAAARRIDISLERRDGGGEVIVRLSDDGRGMQPGAKKSGFGLNGMRERVEMLGGSLAIDSAPGRGLTLEARLPATENDR